MTEDEYKEWRKNKLLYGMHWQRLIDRNTSELLKYNQTAIKFINGEVPQIFASGYNKVAEQIPDSPVAGFDFELINADTVNNLIHEDGIILPPKKKVDPEKDKAWNAKLINAQLLQGIMQGESIPEMAKRMQTVANSDLAGATRTARTMHTAAQNAGRQSGYNRAAQQGAVFEKTWLAANNERTRLSHSLMNGQTVAHDEKFVSPVTGVKLMFPGDWNAEGGDVGSEIYNCFLGETIIASDSDVIRSYKHKYTGKIISVETAGGVKFSCTPNHPILTPRGWIAAEFLKSSDDILVTLRSEVGSARINPYINHAFARIDTIHELFAMFGRKRTCRLGVDFHGDIPTSDVEIVTQKRLLWYNIKSVFRNRINKFLLKHADSSFVSKSASVKHFRSVFLSSFSNMRSMCKSFSFIGTGLSHSSVHSTGTITRNNVVLTEYPIDNLAAESVLDGDTLSGLSGKVFIDKIVNVNVFNSSTHVYNLQTEYGYYLVNSSITDQSRPDIGIFAIAHNCRCTMITKFKGFKKLNGEEPEPARTQEETTQQQSKAAELSKGAKAIVKYFKKYFTDEQTERFTEMLTTNEAENRWFDNLKNQGAKWKKVASNCSWNGETIRWKLDDSPTKKEFTTIFHESGHAIDYFMGNGNYSANEIDKLVNLGCLDSLRANRRSTTDEFLAAMRKDKEALLSLLEKDADAVYKDLHVDNTYTNGIQDFIDGIYGYNNASLKICDWAHGEDYWNRANRFCRIMGKRVEAADYYNSVGIEVKNDEDLKRVMRDYDTATELWAHLNATYVYGGENYEIMNKYCPNAMKTFRKMMEEET